MRSDPAFPVIGHAHPGPPGQVNITAALLLVGAVVAGVWIWKRLSPDLQDYVVDYAVPTIVFVGTVTWGIWLMIRTVRRRRALRRERARLITRF